MRCIKYLIKYMTKGEDRTTVLIQENLTVNEDGSEVIVVHVNEISKFLNATYYSSSESAWRLLTFDVQYHHPSV